MSDAPNGTAQNPMVQPAADPTPAAPAAAAPTPTPAAAATAPSANPDGTQLPLAPQSGDPQLTPKTQPAPAPGHGILGDIFQDLAGGKKTVWTQTPNGPVATKVDLKPGEMARGILAAALTGMAAGSMPGAGQGAFGLGFNAQQKQTEQNADKAKEAAQTTFKNKQSADELTLRKQQSALEQQEGIKRLQADDDLHAEAIQKIRQGDFTFSDEYLKRDQEQADRLALQQKAGMVPLKMPDGSDAPEFATPAEAMQWANANPKIAVKKGNYYNVPTHDPATHRWIVMEVPKTWDDLQWLGVETNSDGTPKKDSDGNMIPNGDFKVNGKSVAPGGQITQHQLYESQQNELGLQTKKVDLEDAKVRLENAQMNYKKDARINRAMEEYDRANGDPLAVDPTTHAFIMSSSARDIVSDTLTKKAAMENAVFTAASKRLQDIGNPKPGTPDYDIYVQAKSAQDSAQNNLNLLQNQALMLNSTPDIANVLANSIVKQYTNPDGFDEKGADEAVNKMNLESGKAQAVRQQIQLKTSGRTATDFLSTPDKLNAVVSVMKDQIKNGSNIAAEISKIKAHPEYSLADIAKLTAALEQANVTPAPSTVGPNAAGRAMAIPVDQGARTTQTPAMEGMTR